MHVNVYYIYSLDNWTVGLADRSMFAKEVVLKEYMLEMC